MLKRVGRGIVLPTTDSQFTQFNLPLGGATRKDIEQCLFLCYDNNKGDDVPRNAVGEMIPVLLAVRMATPESINGTEKSTTPSRSEFIMRDAKATSTFRLINSDINPFHFPLCCVPHLASCTRANSYVKPIFSANFTKRSMQKPEQHW